MHCRRKLIACVFAFAVCTLAGPPKPNAEIRLIVQGDDMGAAHGINVGTIRAYKEGILRVTNVIVPGPWMLEAAKMLNENPGLDVGVHLVMTSEWELFKWRPLTYGRSIVDQNGCFFPMVVPTKGFPPGSTLVEAKPNIAEVEKELRAQIERAKRLVPQVSYLGTHMGFASPFPEWQALIRKLAKEYGLVMPGADLNIQRIGRMYNAGRDTDLDSADVRADKVAQALDKLGPGTWVTVDHAAVDTPEMQGIFHYGYTSVAADRAAVMAAWTSPRVMEVVRRRGIKLVSYRDLLREANR
jgi:predicted glycoside hydrolase/deacetylase ChbG (UPF0249 family)